MIYGYLISKTETCEGEHYSRMVHSIEYTQGRESAPSPATTEAIQLSPMKKSFSGNDIS